MNTDEFLEECESIVERIEVLAMSLPDGSPIQKVVQDLGGDVWRLSNYAFDEFGDPL